MEVAAHSSPPKRPRVLFVITKATWGGAQRYVSDLIAESRAHGFSPALAYGLPGLLSERAEIHEVPTHEVRGLARDISLADDVRAFGALYRLFRRERPDVVHLNSSKASALGALAARLAGIRSIVFTAHGWAFTERRSLLSRHAFRLIHYLTVLLSTRTIAVSDAIAAHARGWPFVAGKITVIRHGIRQPVLMTREEARTWLIEHDPTLRTRAGQLWVGTIAELHPNKGIDVGIEAWRHAKIPDACWIVLGGGQDDAALRKQAAALPNIHLLGFIPDASVYLRAFDLFLLPSRTEALGYVLLEAGVAGLPVIATAVGGISEIIEDGQSGLLVPSGDAAALSGALVGLIKDEERRAELAANLTAKVREEFSLQEMIRKTFALYQR
ncbi:MAG TPA: glycosyltransferase [Candidatus Paceibacterota bacterium]|nr:glycosyltransferase [Candidatus Paceibacterota bacterium]